MDSVSYTIDKNGLSGRGHTDVGDVCLKALKLFLYALLVAVCIETAALKSPMLIIEFSMH